MPRRGFVPKREVLPDPVYGTTVVTKLINQIMLDGKRGIAQSVCYDAFNMLAEKTGKSVEVVTDACERDNFMTAEEAMEFGIIDRVLERH